MPPNILLFYCSNLWALTTSAPKFLPGLLLVPQRGILHTSKCVSHFPNRQAGRPVKKHLYTSKRAPFPPRLLSAPQIAKGGYLYTPQIKFGRILNNSRFGRLYGVFLRRRHSAFLQIAPISRRSARYQKLSNPPLPLFARSANCTRFLRHAFFQHKSAVLQNCTHFRIFHLFAKISTFLRTAILRAFLAFLFLRLSFQKTAPLLRVPKNQALF